MTKQQWILVGSAGLGVGLGAGLMYLLDPQGGNRRRAVARDKAVSKLKKGGDAALKTSRHLGNRTKGLVLESTSKLRGRKNGDGATAAFAQADLAERPGVATDLSHGDSLHHGHTPELDPQFRPLL